jgi:hypothetical protein
MDNRVHDTPSDVEAEDGTVYVDGPDGVAVALSPEAAKETSDRLLEKATEASGQRHFKRVDEEQQRPLPTELA